MHARRWLARGERRPTTTPTMFIEEREIYRALVFRVRARILFPLSSAAFCPSILLLTTRSKNGGGGEERRRAERRKLRSTSRSPARSVRSAFARLSPKLRAAAQNFNNIRGGLVLCFSESGCGTDGGCGLSNCGECRRIPSSPPTST